MLVSELVCFVVDSAGFSVVLASALDEYGECNGVIEAFAVEIGSDAGIVDVINLIKLGVDDGDDIDDNFLLLLSSLI